MKRIHVRTEKRTAKSCKVHGRRSRVFLSLLCFLCAFFGLSASLHAMNLYAPVTVQVPVYCEKVNNDSKAVYQIRMECADKNKPKPAADTITVDGAKTGTFEITVSEPETLKYTVSQIKGSAGDVTYDERVYDVYVCVVNDANNELTYTVSVTLAGSATKPDKLLFANTKKASPSPSDDSAVTVPVNTSPEKAGFGRSSKTGENTTVRFAIYAGLLGILIIGAVIYIILINRKSRKSEEENSGSGRDKETSECEESREEFSENGDER